MKFCIHPTCSIRSSISRTTEFQISSSFRNITCLENRKLDFVFKSSEIPNEAHTANVYKGSFSNNDWGWDFVHGRNMH